MKTVLEQLTYGPVLTTSFFFFMGLMDKKTIEESTEEVRNKFWPTYKVQFFYLEMVFSTFNVAIFRMTHKKLDSFCTITNILIFCCLIFFFRLIQIGIFYWTTVQTLNYTLIPERNRVPIVSIFGLIWTTFLAYMQQKSVSNETKEITHKNHLN